MKRKWCPNDEKWVTPEKEFDPRGMLLFPAYVWYYLFLKPGKCPHCDWRNLQSTAPDGTGESASDETTGGPGSPDGSGPPDTDGPSDELGESATADEGDESGRSYGLGSGPTDG